MSWMLYGAYGFSGTLIAEEAVKRGHRPLLAGRSQDKLSALADKLGLDYLVLHLEDQERLISAVSDCDLVLNAAGPYGLTAGPMIETCITAKSHYLDICGELPVIPKILAYNDQAAEAGIALIPAVGFDVVPSDCLLRYVSQQLTPARELELAICGIERPSVGTVISGPGIVSQGGFIRRDGDLVPLPFGEMTRTIRFSSGQDRLVMAVPWADLATAYQSTGIPNITVYFALHPRQIRLIKLAGSAAQSLLSSGLIQSLIKKTAKYIVKQPDAAYRQEARSYLWARAAGDEGASVEAWLQTTESYRLTAEAAVRSVEKTLNADLQGALTPAQAFGADFILELDDTYRFDSLDKES